MASLALQPPVERWEVATTWREGRQSTSATGGGVTAADCIHETSQRVGVVRLAMLRTCYSERYGIHIPRMFHDLLTDIEWSFMGGQAPPHSAAATTTGKAFPVPSSSSSSSSSPSSSSSQKHAGNNGGVVGKMDKSAVLFHVTEYDVTKGRYPQSWNDYAGYLVPGGIASACSDEPWMMTLLNEIKGLRASGRPVLAFCLGHQVMAQALGGLVRARTGPIQHYAVQESKVLLGSPQPSSQSSAEKGTDWEVHARTVLREAAAAMSRGVVGAGVGGMLSPSLPQSLRLLYHHNDEVVQLPPGAINVSTSHQCNIHGMLMMKNDTDGRRTDIDPPQPNLFSLQAHPEMNYEYGRRVLVGILDHDVNVGRLTLEAARQLKEEMSSWDHTEFPIAVEIMKKVLEPAVRACDGIAPAIAARNGE